MKQSEKKGLSKREKILVFGGGSVGLLILMFNFVFTPLNADIESKTADLETLEMRWRVIEAQLLNEANIREGRDKAFERYYEIREEYIDEGLNQEIGRELTFLVREHDFREISQNISGLTPFREGGVTGTPHFSVLPVNMTLGGGYDEVKWILDTLEVSPYYSITRFGLSFGGETGYEVGQVSLAFRVIMLRNEEIQKALDIVRPPAEADDETPAA